MASALVGGAFLSGFANVLLDRLSSPEIVHLIRGKKLDHKLLQKLKTTLYAVRAVLNDAEQKHIKDPEVKNWLDDLKHALYVADDLLDEVSTKAATPKEVSDSFSRSLNFQENEMVIKLEDITDRLKDILELKDSLGLKEIAKENFSGRVPSSSIEDGSNIYGRDNDKEAILRLLLDDDESNCDGKMSVISIVGMGGVGKTTLAQLLFNDDNVKHKFDFTTWVCLSEEFDILRAMKTITGAVTRSTCDLNDINLLHLNLKDKLKGKKFFIVLDDVWIEDYVKWNLLKKPFQYGRRGSKILVTTRSEKVASVVQTFAAYHLNHLSDDDCWLVFANHACLSSDSNHNVNKALQKIGKEIVKKCKGSPLAAQSLGGMLRTKRDIMHWNDILNNDIWELFENENHIIPALRISYHYLPPHLKRCFVYCSLYPKDYEFDKNILILLWMAEDLLHPQRKGKTLEEVGYEYFDDLTSRSFFQHSSTGSGSFVVHDLMHDLATSLGEKFYLRSEELGEKTEINEKTRHLSFSKFSDPISENFEAFRGVKFLRTFLPINFKYAPFSNEKAPNVVLSKFKCLRVLSFSRFEFLDALPDSIGELIHLRYLDLSLTMIETLPESLSNLYNLQTLRLLVCRKLTMLPNCIQNLINLRYLCFRGTNIKEMPRGMSKLKHLQELCRFVVGIHEENGIRQLGELSNLHGSLSIEKLENVSNSSEALEARMMDKKHIESLTLDWSSGDDVNNSQTEMDILCNLKPHQLLKKLWLRGYRGTRFPEWVGHSSYYNMTTLAIIDCKNCWMLPSLGQVPSLKHLIIKGLDGLMIIGVDFYKNDESSSGTPFPSLESLEFSKMPCWQEWCSIEADAFPQLKCLEINDCPRLRGDLPNHLPALEELIINGCEQLASSLPRAPTIRTLEISDCSPTISFMGDSLPASLKTLYIRNCRKLEFPMQHQHQSLESLKIHDSCDSLTSLPLETFPNITHLYINNCENLESLSVSLSLDATPQRLSSLVISKCHKLKSLPWQMNTLLPKLKYLSIANCPEIESFPKGNMPPTLRSIEIINCEKLLSGLACMDMLTHVTIRGPLESVKSFPKEGLLPPSLTSLTLSRLSCMETFECKGLLHLTSLQQLRVEDCRQLQNMAGERLPASLLKLYIYGNSLLQERCRMKDPQIWPKISHIRSIEVNGISIS